MEKLPRDKPYERMLKAKILEMVGLDGMFSTHTKEYNEVYETGKYNEILWGNTSKDLHDPSLVDVSEHFMIICRK